jgi:hypothetical protein
MKIKYFILNLFKITSLYELRKNSALKDQGWFLSFEKSQPINNSGQPIPWITYPAIYFLEKRLQNVTNLSIFEYGAGNSSLWWTNYSSKVDSVEHDPAWFQSILKIKNGKLNIYLENLESDQYIKKPLSLNQKYNIVVVDGRRRVECVKNSIAALKEDGILILDNSNRSEYLEAFSFLEMQGFHHVEFGGMTPMGVELSETAIFYREKNFLNL